MNDVFLLELTQIHKREAMSESKHGWKIIRSAHDRLGCVYVIVLFSVLLQDYDVI